MIRKVSLFVFVTALVVSACGRQAPPARSIRGRIAGIHRP